MAEIKDVATAVALGGGSGWAMRSIIIALFARMLPISIDIGSFKLRIGGKSEHDV